jgi:hypothetical protein
MCLTYFNKKPYEKNISEKYSMLELSKVTFNYGKHDKPNHILLADI